MTACYTCKFAIYHKEISAGPDGPKEPRWIECTHPAIPGSFAEGEIDWRTFTCESYESKEVFDTERVNA